MNEEGLENTNEFCRSPKGLDQISIDCYDISIFSCATILQPLVSLRWMPSFRGHVERMAHLITIIIYTNVR